MRANRSKSSRVSGSPSSAAATMSGPETFPSSSSARANRLSGLSRASSEASRSSAWPEQYASTQPLLGQLPGQGGPSGFSVKCPSSAPSPCAPRKIRPRMITPPPTPVPSVSMTSSSQATNWASARAAQLASLSTNTGTPKRPPSSSRSDTPVSGMLTLVSTVPVENSICEGTPTPTAAGSPTRSITSRTAASRPSRRSEVLARAVGCSTRSFTSARSTAATATLVPPTSTPSTGGSESTRDSYPPEALGASPVTGDSPGRADAASPRPPRIPGGRTLPPRPARRDLSPPRAHDRERDPAWRRAPAGGVQRDQRRPISPEVQRLAADPAAELHGLATGGEVQPRQWLAGPYPASAAPLSAQAALRLHAAAAEPPPLPGPLHHDGHARALGEPEPERASAPHAPVGRADRRPSARHREPATEHREAANHRCRGRYGHGAAGRGAVADLVRGGYGGPIAARQRIGVAHLSALRLHAVAEGPGNRRRGRPDIGRGGREPERAASYALRGYGDRAQHRRRGVEAGREERHVVGLWTVRVGPRPRRHAIPVGCKRYRRPDPRAARRPRHRLRRVERLAGGMAGEEQARCARGVVGPQRHHIAGAVSRRVGPAGGGPGIAGHGLHLAESLAGLRERVAHAEETLDPEGGCAALGIHRELRNRLDERARRRLSGDRRGRTEGAAGRTA